MYRPCRKHTIRFPVQLVVNDLVVGTSILGFVQLFHSDTSLKHFQVMVHYTENPHRNLWITKPTFQFVTYGKSSADISWQIDINNLILKCELLHFSQLFPDSYWIKYIAHKRHTFHDNCSHLVHTAYSCLQLSLFCSGNDPIYFLKEISVRLNKKPENIIQKWKTEYANC